MTNEKYGFISLFINRDDFIELKRLYHDSKEGQIFLFKGKEVLREYAKYIIEYLDQQFKEEKRA